MRRDGEILKDYFLTDGNILDSFYCDFQLSNAQGGFYKDHHIYIAQGSPKAGYVYLRDIDLNERRENRVIDMLSLGFIKEPVPRIRELLF